MLMVEGNSNRTLSASALAGMWTDARLLGHWHERRSRENGRIENEKSARVRQLFSVADCYHLPDAALPG